ncbi:MAG: Outer membrane lipoprotein carrier protein LolA [Rickettsia helvetica]|uniref:Outer membrane lipoprotein carrier protein LolA n=1 Tax=Rickettsia helvetica TaxID=35789 RepID=A0ABM9N9W6_RICHE
MSEQHKKELLEITENFPADIASLIDYIDKTFKCHIHDLSLSDQKDLKFFIAKSFANQIDTCKTKEHTQNFLQELQELREDLFEEILEDKPVYSLDIDGATHYAELDFTELNQNNFANIYLEKQQYNSQSILISNIQNNHNNYILFPKIINLEEQVTIDVLNNLLLLGAYNNM